MEIKIVTLHKKISYETIKHPVIMEIKYPKSIILNPHCLTHKKFVRDIIN